MASAPKQGGIIGYSQWIYIDPFPVNLLTQNKKREPEGRPAFQTTGR